jgi:hypothetical protein
MKRLALMIFGVLVSSLCSAQIQTGNASCSPSKAGMTISHPSLSFNTHVRVTNLRNGRSVEAVVNGRIPISPERVADVSREAGAALGMDAGGLTPVEIEVLIRPPARAEAGSEPPRPEPAAAPPVPEGGGTPSSSPPAPPGQAAPPPQILPVQTVTDIQYVPVPDRSGCCPLLCAAVLLLLLAVIVLAVILAAMLRRFYLWPWHYPVWYRRHLLRAGKRRRETRP